MPKQINDDQIKRYWSRRGKGYPMRASATYAGFGLTTARKIEAKGPPLVEPRSNTGARVRRNMENATDLWDPELPAPKRYDDLCPEAQEAWNSFPYFQERYLGRRPIPWQSIAGDYVIELLETEDEEYAVVNAPPGSGKTLVFTHDIPAWLTVRNRAIRGQLGSVTGALAERYTRRLRNTLERTLPFKAPTDQLEAGTAIDAVATLAADFGYFKPLERELWTANQFVVAQYADEGSAIEKEATWTAYGFDMGFIGGRFNFVAWDDLVDPKRQRTTEAREQLEVDWDDQGETRLEPGGVLLLNGQRLFANDLYRYNLDKMIPTLVDDDTGEIIEAKPKYHHLIFKAHDTDFCREGTHAKGAPAWDNTPEGGCLLSPRRLPYTKLMGLKANSPRFEVVYQQQDVDPEDVLVRQEWIEGDSSHPGCYDHDRARLQLPFNLEGPLFSCMSIDPSPTKYWGIEWLVHQPATKITYLMDLERKVMDAPALLDYNPQTKTFTGLLEEWWQTSCVVGQRITHVIVEINAAQRFLLQYAHVRAWCQLRSVIIVPHSTHRNKSDPEYGVQMLAPEFEFGRLRLPYKKAGDTRMKTTFLVSEVTKYGSQAGKTTDLTMALWFFFHQLPNICHVDHVPKQSWRPSWLRQPASVGGRDSRGLRV